MGEGPMGLPLEELRLRVSAGVAYLDRDVGAVPGDGIGDLAQSCDDKVAAQVEGEIVAGRIVGIDDAVPDGYDPEASPRVGAIVIDEVRGRQTFRGREHGGLRCHFKTIFEFDPLYRDG